MNKLLKKIAYIIVLVLALSGCNNSVDKDVKVHYIDVGQADCILVETNTGNVLIDAGNNSDGEFVVEYIKQQGIKKLDYVIGTHPHEDHIGGLDDVIDSFEIGTIIMPKVTHTTKTYEDVLLAVKNKGKKIQGAKKGQSFVVGECNFEILSPIKEKYDTLNEYSVVVKMVHRGNSFLFMADALGTNEKEIMEAKSNLDVDVLKVGHHGSNTSTTKDFLDEVTPKVAVIFAGKNNSYGHPHKEVLNRLENVEVYRTDKDGTIIIESDGEKIYAHCENR